MKFVLTEIIQNLAEICIYENRNVRAQFQEFRWVILISSGIHWESERIACGSIEISSWMHEIIEIIWHHFLRNPHNRHNIDVAAVAAVLLLPKWNALKYERGDCVCWKSPENRIIFWFGSKHCDAIQCHTVIIAIRFCTKYGKHVKTLGLNSKIYHSSVYPQQFNCISSFSFSRSIPLCSFQIKCCIRTQTNKNKSECDRANKCIANDWSMNELGKRKPRNQSVSSICFYFVFFSHPPTAFWSGCCFCYCQCRTSSKLSVG